MAEQDPTLELEALRDTARRLTQGRFEKEHSGWYLVQEVPPSRRSAVTFETESVDSVQGSRWLKAAVEGLPVPESVLLLQPGRGLLHALRKTGRNAWARQIAVGRAPNNDVVIRDSSVSKLHALVNTPRPGFQEGPRLEDAGSHNGTRLNDVALSLEQQVRLSPDDVLYFGRVKVVVLDAATLYDRLRTWR